MDRNLWLEFAPFGRVPLSRKQIDANVLKFQPLSESQVLVLGTDRKLWLESGAFGNAPLPRKQVDENVGPYFLRVRCAASAQEKRIMAHIH